MITKDIELINKKLAAENYIEQAKVKLKENSDNDSYEILIKKING
jgi:hypothetical protein